MKRIILYCSLLPAFALFFTACKKKDVPPPPDTRFPFPLITKDNAGDDFISGRDPESFEGKFIVDMYYGTEVVAQKVDVVVIRNGNKSNVKTIKANVTSFPSPVQVTGTQLTTLFDSTIQLGDTFEIAADVTTKGGEKFPGFPLTGNPYNADTATLPGSSFSIAYASNCTFDKADFNGFYKVLANTWDYQAGDWVEVRPGADNSIMITAWPNPDAGIFTRIPMRVMVDPATNVATVPLQVVGEFAGGMAHIIDEGTGTVSPCGDKITLSLMFMVGTYYGAQSLVLGK